MNKDNISINNKDNNNFKQIIKFTHLSKKIKKSKIYLKNNFSLNKNSKKIKTKNNPILLSNSLILNFSNSYKPTIYNQTLENNKIIQKIENFSLKNKSKNFIDYKNDLDSIMSNYIYKSSNENINNIENEFSKTKKKFYFNKKNEYSNILTRSKRINALLENRMFPSLNIEKSSNNINNLKSLNNQTINKTINNQTLSDNLFNNSKIKIYPENTNYKNPFESLGLVLRNKTIHDKILLTLNERSIKKFGLSINKFKNLNQIRQLNKYVKVTNLIPKIEHNIFNDQINKSKEENITNNEEIKSIKTNNNISNKTNNNIFEDISEIDNKVDYNKSRVISISPLYYQQGYVYLLSRFISNSILIPESREQFSFNIDLTTNQVYLFGGFSSNIKKNSFWKLDALTFIWTYIKPNEGKNPENRFGHSGVIYKNKLIIYGGKYINLPYFANLDIYNIETKIWTTPNLISLDNFKKRKNHIALMIGQQMFIQGGISEDGEFLNDCYLLNFNPLKWLYVEYTIFGYNKDSKIMDYSQLKKNEQKKYDLLLDKISLAYHSACLVVPLSIQNDQKFNIYKFPEQNGINKRTNNTRIREKGIYIFGGKSKYSEQNNNLRVIKIGKKPLEFITLKCEGKPPLPRYSTSINFFEDGNFIVIHGGKFDDSYNNESSLNDTFLLELYRLEWLRIDFGDENNNVYRRFNHCSIISGKNLIIFGGMNENNYIGTQLFVVNLDPDIASEKLKGKELFGLNFGIDNNVSIIKTGNNSPNNNKIKKLKFKNEKFNNIKTDFKKRKSKLILKEKVFSDDLSKY